MDDTFDQEPILADEATLQQAMDEVDGGSPAIAKEIFVLAKTLFTLYQTLKAAWAWRNAKMRMAKPATGLLIFSALILIYGYWYKHSSKEIAPLVVLQGLSHYNSFCILHVLLGHVECAKFRENRK